MSNCEDPDDHRIYPVILDGTFFKVKSVDNDGKNVSAKCNLCKAETLISGSLAATGNFLLHLKRKHQDSIADYENRKKTEQPLIKKKKQELKEPIANTAASKKRAMRKEESRLAIVAANESFAEKEAPPETILGYKRSHLISRSQDDGIFDPDQFIPAKINRADTAVAVSTSIAKTTDFEFTLGLVPVGVAELPDGVDRIEIDGGIEEPQSVPATNENFELNKDNIIANLQAELYEEKKNNRKLRSKLCLPTKFFFRKLIFEGEIFTLEEIANSSLTGKPSPAFRNNVRRCIDPIRFKAFKDYTTEIFGLKPNTVEWLTFEKKLHNIPGDARKKMNRLTGLAGNSTITSQEFSRPKSDDSETRVEEYLNLVGDN
ncbi:Protein stand still [Folsomia candida]|uniref:Protein stand still n=1 Tax=Folsomia candida TaxID=158441 RepID=A0A226F561_FOLCA|nr:Protein stand still [Folsomia candida]